MATDERHAPDPVTAAGAGDVPAPDPAMSGFAPAGRGAALMAALAADPRRHHIFQALRLVEAAFPDRPRLGRARRPAQDPVRLGQEVELAFPPSTLASFSAASGGPAVLKQLFFGLFGPQGPLPLHLTEYARDRERNWRDPTLSAFADIFHHRLLSLLYRAWASGEPAASFDRADDDPFGDKVAALIGLRMPAFRGRDALPDVAKLHMAGRLTQGPKNADGLLAMVSCFLRVPAALESFVGSWLALEPGDRAALGGPRAPLGMGAVLGTRVWSRQAKFRLRLGPLALPAYRRLLPGGDSLRRLDAIVKGYAGEALDWDVNLVLARGAAPRTSLGRQGQLGWTTWIGTAAAGREAADLYLRPGAAGPVSRKARP